MIKHSIEIDRRPEDVFAYLDDVERHGEWQTQIVSAKKLSDGPVGIGTKVAEKRNVQGRTIDTDYEITEHDPPRRSSFKGITGPVRAVGAVTVEPVGDGSRSRVSLDFNLVGSGLGKLLALLARRSARKEVPEMQQRLKQRLESAVDG